MSNPAEFEEGYEPPKLLFRPIRAVFYTVAATFAVFFLLPFTQILSGIAGKTQQFRAVEIAPPPPPPPVEEEEEEIEEEVEEPPPPMEEPPPPLDLTQLELALNPGIGDAMAGAFGFSGFDVQPDAVEDMQIFSLKDLDEKPQLLQGVAPIYPHELKRERIKGVVKLLVLVDESGRVNVMRVVNSTHPSFENPARDAAEKFKYSPPMKDGRPVKTKYVLPIRFTIS